jgi:hypothetical protein
MDKLGLGAGDIGGGGKPNFVLKASPDNELFNL